MEQNIEESYYEAEELSADESMLQPLPEMSVPLPTSAGNYQGAQFVQASRVVCVGGQGPQSPRLLQEVNSPQRRVIRLDEVIAELKDVREKAVRRAQSGNAGCRRDFVPPAGLDMQPLFEIKAPQRKPLPQIGIDLNFKPSVELRPLGPFTTGEWDVDLSAAHILPVGLFCQLPGVVMPPHTVCRLVSSFPRKENGASFANMGVQTC